MYVYMYIHMCVCMYVCMHVYMYIHMYVCMYIYLLIERMADVTEIRSGFCQLSEGQTGFTSEIQSPADGQIRVFTTY